MSKAKRWTGLPSQHVSVARPTEGLEELAPITLPFFREAVDVFSEAFSFQLFASVRSDGVLSTISQHVIHEGRSSRLKRATGETEEAKMRTMTTEIGIKF